MKHTVNFASFPVVFYDGEHESDIGDITIYPSMDFKVFLSILSQTIGISPHQFTVYRVDRKDANLWPENRKRSPITAKVNFAAIVRDRDCFFLVVLKRSRKERRQKNSNHALREPIFYDLTQFYNNPSQSQYVDLANRYFYGSETSPKYDTVAKASYSSDYTQQSVQDYSTGTMMNGYDYNTVVVCEKCQDAAMKGSPPEFHCCSYDPVVVFVRSVAGVIARPAKLPGDF